ncbi:MAG: AAA family ATPase [Alphaproteobacteria bacterium]|nr:AAA family ATPase [Alphaproteobacteria bacterium]
MEDEVQKSVETSVQDSADSRPSAEVLPGTGTPNCERGSSEIADEPGDIQAQSTASLAIADTRSSRARRWSSLNSITVRNFKATEEAVIPVSRVTILVGPNGCGKSSVLQAIHWAARAASFVPPKNTKEMISFERLDYVPSSEPLKTLHKGELKTDATSTPVEVVFSHQTSGQEAVEATVRIRAARNRGGITAYMDGGAAVTPYKQRIQFITAYIPGLAGLAERETILAQPTLRRQAASGDAGGVLRNILLNIKSRRLDEVDETGGQARLRLLNELINRVHPGASLDVSFDEREDYHISASIWMEESPGKRHPLEVAATGVLQVAQIFAYLILFEPKVLLIDEPDAHLHPDKQERLIEALERAASDYDTQVILTTHSPHIVRAASPAAKLVWMSNGRVHTEDDDAIRRILGWGGLDKSVLFFVEDEDDKPLRSILRQWPDLSRQISICRCFGIGNLPRDKLLEGLLVDGELKVTAIVHRDGDFMTEEEAKMWTGAFKTTGVFPWVTAGSDMEGYFCSASYLAALYDISVEEAESWRNEAAQSIGKAHDTFLDKRREIVRAVWPDGGSPNAETIWTDAGGKTPSTVKGKELHRALKNVVGQKGKDSKLLNAFTIPAGFVVA